MTDIPNRDVQRPGTTRKAWHDDGWTPLEFYAYIVRTVGIPDRFRLVDGEWVADAPFTKPSAETLELLEAQGV